jgi:hypothetical protein
MPSRLTFGVELEFALALLAEGQDDPEPELPQAITILPKSSNPHPIENTSEVMNAVFDLVATKLVEAGLPTRGISRKVHWSSSEANSYSPEENLSRSSSDGSSHVQDDGVGWIPSRRHWRQKKHQQIMKDTNDQNDDLIDLTDQPAIVAQSEFGNQWMVTTDVTVGPTNPGNYSWFNMEVQSPPYIFCEDSLQAVRLVCKTLTSEFRVETNASTGLHVHVGEGADGYPLQTVKKLMAFLWTFEPQIDQLHPNRRARLSNDDELTWYESLRRGSTLVERQSIDPSAQLTVVEGLNHIYKTDQISDLFNWMRPEYRKSAYHIGHLDAEWVGETMKKTIEFRQHEGTLHGARVVEWIKTVIALMEWIEDVEAIPLMEFLMDAADFEDRCWPEEEKPPYDIIDLFNDIGLVEQAAYWDQAIPRGTRNDPTQYYKLPRQPSKVRDAPKREYIDISDDSAHSRG